EHVTAPYPSRPYRDRVNEIREQVQYLASIVECLVNVIGQNNSHSIPATPQGSPFQENGGGNPIQRDLEEDSETRSCLTRGAPIEEGEDTEDITEQGPMLLMRTRCSEGNERTSSSRTRGTVFKRLALDNRMNTYIPRRSEHLGTTDLRERLNEQRREAQAYYSLSQQNYNPTS
ncbi:hypothetical protein TorRG33x02_273480, partial [Trema orientale]